MKATPKKHDDHRAVIDTTCLMNFDSEGMSLKTKRQQDEMPKQLSGGCGSEANEWLHLTPPVAALGMDAFERDPQMIAKVPGYIL